MLTFLITLTALGIRSHAYGHRDKLPWCRCPEVLPRHDRECSKPWLCPMYVLSIYLLLRDLTMLRCPSVLDVVHKGGAPSSARHLVLCDRHLHDL